MARASVAGQVDYFSFSDPADRGGRFAADLIQVMDYLSVNGTSFGLGPPSGAALETGRFVSGSGANLVTTQFGYDSANGHAW